MTQVGPPSELYNLLLLVGFFSATLFAYPIFRLLLALKSRQTVSQYAPEGHQKKQGTPTMGGLIIVAGTLVGLAWALVSMPHRIPNYFSAPLWAGVALVLGFGMIGFVDDFVVPRMIAGKRGLGWKQKIVMQLVVAIGAVFLDHPKFDLGLGAGVFLILFFSNAYNFSDGLDWLAGSLLLALGLGVVAVACVGRAYEVVTLMLPMIGAAIPFLILNRPPARLFMGDVGSLPIGALLGYCFSGIAMPSLAPHLYSMGYLEARGEYFFEPPAGQLVGVIAALLVLSIMMIVELVPVPLQIASVKLRKKRLFSYTPIHHAFEKKGWKEGKVVALFFTCQVVFSLAAFGIANFAAAREQQSKRDTAIEHVREIRGSLVDR